MARKKTIEAIETEISKVKSDMSKLHDRYDKLAEKLTQVIKSALLFFPVKDVFIGGQVEGLEQVVEKISQNFAFQPVIRKAGEPGKQICDIFARQILWENCYALIEVN